MIKAKDYQTTRTLPEKLSFPHSPQPNFKFPTLGLEKETFPYSCPTSSCPLLSKQHGRVEKTKLHRSEKSQVPVLDPLLTMRSQIRFLIFEGDFISKGVVILAVSDGIKYMKACKFKSTLQIQNITMVIFCKGPLQPKSKIQYAICILQSKETRILLMRNLRSTADSLQQKLA